MAFAIKMGWIRIHGGLNWDWSNKLVVVPIYANFRLSPKIGEETRITLNLDLEKIALGRGNLTGTIKNQPRNTKRR
jgi:hypothetical protein